MKTIFLILPALAVLGAAALCGGCAPKWVNHNLEDQSQASEKLKLDNEFCDKYAESMVPTTYGRGRYSSVELPFEQAAEYLHNYEEGMDRGETYDACMKSKGWSKK